MRPCMSVVGAWFQAYQITHVNQDSRAEVWKPVARGLKLTLVNYTLISGETSFRGVVAASNPARSFARGRFERTRDARRA